MVYTLTSVKSIPRANISDISLPYRSSRAYTVITVTFATAVLGVASVLTHEGLVLPPLGPTLFIVFAFPLSKEAYPRNVVGAHFVAILAGIGALVIFGLVGVHGTFDAISWTRLAALLVAMIVCVAALTTLRLLHVPALATVMLIALGMLESWNDWVAISIAVLISTGLGLVINRATGRDQPLWTRAPADQEAG